MTDKLNLIETIAKNDTFSTFSRLMGTSGANEAFSAGGDFTVFAPTNDAFGKFPEKQMNALLNEPEQKTLKSILSYHILSGKLFVSDLSGKKSTPTITGTEITISDSNGLKINDSHVQARNIEASNGVVHALETVLNFDTKTLTTGPLSTTAETEKVNTPEPAGLISPAPENVTPAAVAAGK
jgi:transforming growth factor-beta-induced protein